MRKEKKENRVMSFRFDDHILKKIDYLVDEENRRLAGFGIKLKTRKQIIESIIEDHYFRHINKSTDPDVVGRIARMVDDAADSRFAGIENKIDEILYLAIKNGLGNKLLYRSPSVLPIPDNVSDALVSISQNSKWDLALEEYMNKSGIRKRLAAENSKDDGETENGNDDKDDYEDTESDASKIESFGNYLMSCRRR